MQTLPFAINSLPGSNDVMRTQLTNGIVILSRANFNNPSVAISGYMSAGSLFDPDDKLGLADFTSSALMAGTMQRDNLKLYEDMEMSGMSLSFSTGMHYAGFSGRALSEDLDSLLDLLVEILRQPAFALAQIEILRTQLVEAIRIRNSSPNDIAELTFDQTVFKGHPYSRREDGYVDTVQSINQMDLFEFHRNCYGPRGMVIAVVGGIDPTQATKKLNRALGDWYKSDQKSPPKLPPLTPVNKTVIKKATIPGRVQSDIIVGAAGPRRNAPDFMAALVGNSILGQFGNMGRIGEALRERSGLAYYAYSNLSAGIGPGSWEISTAVDYENVDKAIEIVYQEIARFVEEPVIADELSRSQSNFIDRLPLSLESNSGVVNALLNIERHNLGLDYYRHYHELVQAVTAEDVLKAARHYLDPSRLVIVIVGS